MVLAVERQWSIVSAMEKNDIEYQSGESNKFMTNHGKNKWFHVEISPTEWSIHEYLENIWFIKLFLFVYLWKCRWDNAGWFIRSQREESERLHEIYVSEMFDGQ